MKPSPLVLVLVGAAGLGLGWIGLRTILDPPAAYTPVSLDEMPETVPATLSGEVPAGHVVRELDVEGICCAGCPVKLHQALAGIQGVEEIAVDPLLGTASVVVPAELDVATLEGALTFGAYTAHAR